METTVLCACKAHKLAVLESSMDEKIGHANQVMMMCHQTCSEAAVLSIIALSSQLSFEMLIFEGTT